MLGCKGIARDHNQGILKPCPVRQECWLYFQFAVNKPYALKLLEMGPYDFEDEECGEFIEKG